MSKTEDLKRAIFAIADPDKVSPFNGDMVTLFLHEIEKLVDAAVDAEREECAKVCDRIASAIKLYCNEVHVVACADAIRNRGAK